MDPAFAQALKWAKEKGVPEDQLKKAKGLADVNDIYKQWLKDQKTEETEKRREAAGLPSLRDLKAHRRIK